MIFQWLLAPAYESWLRRMPTQPQCINILGRKIFLGTMMETRKSMRPGLTKLFYKQAGDEKHSDSGRLSTIDVKFTLSFRCSVRTLVVSFANNYLSCPCKAI